MDLRTLPWPGALDAAELAAHGYHGGDDDTFTIGGGFALTGTVDGGAGGTDTLSGVSNAALTAAGATNEFNGTAIDTTRWTLVDPVGERGVGHLGPAAQRPVANQALIDQGGQPVEDVESVEAADLLGRIQRETAPERSQPAEQRLGLGIGLLLASSNRPDFGASSCSIDAVASLT